MITRSLKPCVLRHSIMSLVLIFFCRSPWVGRVLQWITQWHEESEGDLSFKEEVEVIVSKLLALYSTVELGSQPSVKVRGSFYRSHKPDLEQLRSTMVLTTFSIVETPSTGSEPSTLMSDRKQLLWSFSNRFEAASYPLLVLVCGLLSAKDYIALCPLLWSDSLADSDAKILAPVGYSSLCVLTATNPPLDMLPCYAMCREMWKRIHQIHHG